MYVSCLLLYVYSTRIALSLLNFLALASALPTDSALVGLEISAEVFGIVDPQVAIVLVWQGFVMVNSTTDVY
jgi:hypothetical protein